MSARDGRQPFASSLIAPQDGHAATAPRTLFFILLTFVLATAARLLELPYWDNPAYLFGGEYLLATHDAYCWIAGAEGFGSGNGQPMAILLRLLSDISGQPPALVGFWVPPFMGGVLAVAVFLWALLLKRPYAGVCAGVLVSLAPAFFARTLLGFYDTDLITLLFALLLGLVPAFWLHARLSSPAQLVFGASRRLWYRLGAHRLWSRLVARFGKHSREAEPFAPLFASRHGASDPDSGPVRGGRATPANDFPSVLCSAPACQGHAQRHTDPLTWPWILMLIVSGLMGYGMQPWHSLFPYLIRFSLLVIPLLILMLGPKGERRSLLAGALCHALPLGQGWLGALLALCYYGLLRFTGADPARQTPVPASSQVPLPEEQTLPGKAQGNSPGLPFLSRNFWHRLLYAKSVLFVAWVALIGFSMDPVIYQKMLQTFFWYVDRQDETRLIQDAETFDAVTFPSVIRSILEAQTISYKELLAYCYPNIIVTCLGMAAFIRRLAITPILVWFIPLLLLSLLSLKMGARMTMFGPPVVLLSFCLEGGLLLELFCQRLLIPRVRRAVAGLQNRGMLSALAAPRAKISPFWREALRTSACLLAVLCLSWPLIKPVPDYTQGPIISREQAESLRFIRDNSDKDGIVWNWWDWGYATQHFAQRKTIADGGGQGDAALFLPAAVYTTADPRFARQIIKYTASKNNNTTEVFAGYSSSEARQLMQDLADSGKPLIEAPGEQYLVVSFELLRLGLWVTHYGSWDFTTKTSHGALINNLNQVITFNIESGVILPAASHPVYAGSIDIFDPDKLERFSYNRYGAYHFIFNTQSTSRGTDVTRSLGLLERFWEYQRDYFDFAPSGNDKMVVDDLFYNSMMVQLLLCDKDDPSIAPYFTLLFDNTYSRVYKVR